MSLEPAPVTAAKLLEVEGFAQAAAMLRSGGAECLLRIASPELGVVRVLLIQTLDGLNIRFVAEQDLTRQMLDRQLDQLRTALANAGIDLGDIEVFGADEPDATLPPELCDVNDDEPHAARPGYGRGLSSAKRLDVIV